MTSPVCWRNVYLYPMQLATVLSYIFIGDNKILKQNNIYDTASDMPRKTPVPVMWITTLLFRRQDFPTRRWRIRHTGRRSRCVAHPQTHRGSREPKAVTRGFSTIRPLGGVRLPVSCGTCLRPAAVRACGFLYGPRATTRKHSEKTRSRAITISPARKLNLRSGLPFWSETNGNADA